MRTKKNFLSALVLALALLVPSLAFAGGGVIVNTATVTADNRFPNGSPGAASATTAVAPGTVEEVPTLSEWGLIALALPLGGLGVVRMRRSAPSVR
jgi:hypothetical protein